MLLNVLMMNRTALTAAAHTGQMSAAKFEKLCYIKKQNMLQISFLSREITELTEIHQHFKKDLGYFCRHLHVI